MGIPDSVTIILNARYSACGVILLLHRQSLYTTTVFRVLTFRDFYGNQVETNQFVNGDTIPIFKNTRNWKEYITMKHQGLYNSLGALCSCCYSDIYRPHSEELSYCRSRGTGVPQFAFSFSRKFLLKKQKGCEQQNTTLMANQCNIFLLATFSAFMCTYGPYHYGPL